MSKQLTPWFPPKVKPVRKGVYIASVARSTFYRYWNGHRWYFGADTVSGAAKERRAWPARYQGAIAWRGLASDPGATS